MESVIITVVSLAVGAFASWLITRRYYVRGSRDSRVLARGIERSSRGIPVDFATTPDGGLATREQKTTTASVYVVEGPDDPKKKPL